jgi:hypothetical protein
MEPFFPRLPGRRLSLNKWRLRGGFSPAVAVGPGDRFVLSSEDDYQLIAELPRLESRRGLKLRDDVCRNPVLDLFEGGVPLLLGEVVTLKLVMQVANPPLGRTGRNQL